METDYDVGGSDNEDDKDEDAKSDSLSFFVLFYFNDFDEIINLF